MLRRSVGSSKSNAAGAAALARRSPPLLLPLLAALLLLRRRREAARLACGRRGMLNSLRHSGSAAVRRQHALNDGSITLLAVLADERRQPPGPAGQRRAGSRAGSTPRVSRKAGAFAWAR